MKNATLYNLMQIFTYSKKPEHSIVDPVQHCLENEHHDFYCDAERPNIILNK